MPLAVPSHASQLLWVRAAALAFACASFSLAAHGAALPHDGPADWCVFCWVFSFAGTVLVLWMEQIGLQARLPVFWANFPVTLAGYAAGLCLSASVVFPVYFLRGAGGRASGEARDYRVASAVFSCLAAAAYLAEVSLSRARPGEAAAGYMATAPGLLKVCQTSTACLIFVLVSEPVSYDGHAALKWCMAVYCVCFVLSTAVVVHCVGECAGCLPFPFPGFLSAYGLLAALMYLTATIVWPVFQFDKRYLGGGPRPPQVVAVSVLTALNFLLYLADLAYSARLVFVRV